MAQWEAFQKIWAKRLREMSDGIRKQTETVHYTVLSQCRLWWIILKNLFKISCCLRLKVNFISRNFLSLFHIFVFFIESVKFAEDPSFKMTLGRMMDITYRLNVGLLNLILDKMRGFVDPVAWVSTVQFFSNRWYVKSKKYLATVSRDLGMLLRYCMRLVFYS